MLTFRGIDQGKDERAVREAYGETDGWHKHAKGERRLRQAKVDTKPSGKCRPRGWMPGWSKRRNAVKDKFADGSVEEDGKWRR